MAKKSILEEMESKCTISGEMYDEQVHVTIAGGNIIERLTVIMFILKHIHKYDDFAVEDALKIIWGLYELECEDEADNEAETENLAN